MTYNVFGATLNAAQSNPSKGLRERLGLDDIISVLQQNRLQCLGHVLRKRKQ